MQLPTLYKLTSTGATQFWNISTEDNVIVTKWGQIDGKEQETRDVIKEGKNAGKKNATTAVQQAESEAQSQWEKKLKKGYVKSLDDAAAGKVDEIIEGGVAVMLAQSFDKHSSKIKYPAFLSPKLDGMRLVAQIKNGKAALWTRTQKPVKSLPHIQRALEARFRNEDLVLDGEAYVGKYKDDFNKIMSLIRPDEPVPGHEIIEYHVFDMVSPQEFSARLDCLQEFNLQFPLVLVEQRLVSNQDEAFQGMSNYIAAGFEGAMIKNASSPYEHKRSYHIQKLKLMTDSEFKIVDVEEGRGKLQGHVGSFICETSTGSRFNAKLKGELSYLKNLWETPALWKNSLLTVQYQNLTPDGIPRFPVGVAIRNYE